MENEKVCFMKEQEGEEVFAKPDEGEMLVIRKALNVRESTKDEQRKNILIALPWYLH